MDSLQISLIMSQRANTHGIHSALPHAPIIEHVEHVAVFGRTRKSVALALHHAADVVAPVPARRSNAALR